MNVLPKQILLLLTSCIVTLLIAAGQHPDVAPLSVQGAPPLQLTPPAQAERPFGLPFTEPPGPDTWLMAQPYGNTTGAYYQRHTLYVASGGIHFGLDLSAPCGTEIVTIADGVVYAVDGPFGSPPHNLMIDHPELGYASMYGHLLEAPTLTPGQFVEQGEVVALVGDSSGDCNRSPHLHLEIRDLKHLRKFNPVNLIEADLNRLTLYGSSGRGFMRDLAEPRKWQTLYDQPEVYTAGPIVNDFERTWPMDWDQPRPEAGSSSGSTTAAGSPAKTLGVTSAATPTLSLQSPTATVTPTATPLPGVLQITNGDCCTNPFWNADSSEVRFIDRPAANRPVGVWGVDITQPGASPRLVIERLGVYNHDGSLIAYPDRKQGQAMIERLADGERWAVDTQGNGVSFTPDGRLLWTVYDSEVAWRARTGEVWLADVDGSNARVLATLRRGGPAAWLSDEMLLITSRVPPAQDTVLSTLSLTDGTITELIQLPRTRGMNISPDRRYLVYMVRLHPEQGNNGIWLLDLEAPKLKPQRLPFFGAYRWRDNQRLVYVPFEPEAEGHVFYEYDLVSGQTRQLFPEEGHTLSLTIANNDWQVSPDGSKIAMVAVRGNELDGIWVVEIGGQ